MTFSSLSKTYYKYGLLTQAEVKVSATFFRLCVRGPAVAHFRSIKTQKKRTSPLFHYLDYFDRTSSGNKGYDVAVSGSISCYILRVKLIGFYLF